MGIIELNSVSKIYRDRCVLKDVSISVEEGDFFGIVGRSGSGKTTLLNIIGLITPFDSGNLFVKSHKNPKVNSRTALLLRRHSIGYLFQNFGLVDNQTVKWNLFLALAYKKISKKKKDLLVEVELEKFGLGYLRDRSIYQLSGGEQQRIAIIRLILQDSSIIIADEPTSSLDVDNEQIIMSYLQALSKQNKTIIMVTHNKQLNIYFNKQYYLD